ncbi:hypothetical protein [Ruania albidiflava]|uniref:hypothetical protein n=1 Tax=Ruania albidiflava TaxID=366586 RepID=UPI0012FCC74A|nr:hypothetical protein [Ruania albidiflava]
MMTPVEQHCAEDRTCAPARLGPRRSRWRRGRAVPVAVLTTMVLAAGATQAMAAPGQDAADSEPAPPSVSATDTEWQDWSADLFDEARSTDWAAESAARGCELISVDIVSTTVPEGALAGAPDSLEVPMVDRVEDCSTTLTADGSAGTAPDTALAAASACRSISGPSTICLSRSGSYVVASYTYRGGGSADGFLRIYQRSSSSGCGTGSTLATRSGSFTSGYTYTRSTYEPGYGHYSAAFWHDTWYGHSNWGTVCDSL